MNVIVLPTESFRLGEKILRNSGNEVAAGTTNIMALNQALCWYQHKIGAYDKQLWEETIEQRILSGLAHVPKKSGKLKLDYIDLDLVRGSSFPKLKPKHGILYISRLCLIRVILLPFYRFAYTDDGNSNDNKCNVQMCTRQTMVDPSDVVRNI